MGIATHIVPTILNPTSAITSPPPRFPSLSANVHARYGLPPAQPNTQNRRRGLPSAEIDRVGGPVRHDAPDGPRLVLWRRRIHVMVGMDVVGGHVGARFGQLPLRR